MRLQFGECTLDLDTRELTRRGEVVHVEPMAYRLLEVLLAARPKALSKDDLQDRLWPKTFVSDHSLARLVDTLRSCLGDHAKSPLYIRTIHRFGYAFCAEAIPGPAAAPPVPEFHCRIVCGGREVALNFGENVIGRDATAALCIDSETVSRRHARVLIGRGSATIEDLGSRNGTFVDGRRIDGATTLTNGARIRLGAATLTFRCFRGFGSTQGMTSSISASPGARS